MKKKNEGWCGLAFFPSWEELRSSSWHQVIQEQVLVVLRSSSHDILSGMKNAPRGK